MIVFSGRAIVWHRQISRAMKADSKEAARKFLRYEIGGKVNLGYVRIREGKKRHGDFVQCIVEVLDTPNIYVIRHGAE